MVLKKTKTIFEDKDRDVVMDYYDIIDALEVGEDIDKIKLEIRKLIKKDPDFCDAYLLLSDIYMDAGEEQKAKIMIDIAYSQAMKLISKRGNKLPATVEWAILENRHILRSLCKKADSYWKENKIIEAYALMENILSINPIDNLGIRFLMLAILEGMSQKAFVKKFPPDKGGSELFEWFDQKQGNYAQEFAVWRATMEEYGKIL